MRRRSALLGVALLLSAVAGAFFWSSALQPAVNLKPSTALGEVLVEEVSRLLGGQGRILMLGREPSKTGPGTNRERIESFQAAVKRRAGLKLGRMEYVPRVPPGMMDLGGVTAEQILGAMEKAPDANALVILAGLPPYSGELAGRITARSLKVVAVCGYGPNVKQWLGSKALVLAVVPQTRDGAGPATAPKTARDWFDREFQIVTPETVGSMGY